MTVKDQRIVRQARAVARADAELSEARRTLREARAKRDAAITRLAYLTEEPAK